MTMESLLLSGTTLHLPEKIIKKERRLLISYFIEKFGAPVCAALLLQTVKQMMKMKKKYPDAVAAVKKADNAIGTHACLMGALFYAVSDRRGKRCTYAIMKEIIRNCASVSLPALYQINAPVTPEGDVFHDFKKCSRTLFATLNTTGLRKNSISTDTENLLAFNVRSCMHVDFYNSIGCPKAAELVCEYERAGYLRIASLIECEFRLPCTIAKGSDYCGFQFYRKGTVPSISEHD